jgi:hypothetical protein
MLSPKLLDALRVYWRGLTTSARLARNPKLRMRMKPPPRGTMGDLESETCVASSDQS